MLYIENISDEVNQMHFLWLFFSLISVIHLGFNKAFLDQIRIILPLPMNVLLGQDLSIFNSVTANFCVT